jgi:hypothetical protein
VVQRQVMDIPTVSSGGGDQVILSPTTRAYARTHLSTSIKILKNPLEDRSITPSSYVLL